MNLCVMRIQLRDNLFIKSVKFTSSNMNFLQVKHFWILLIFLILLVNCSESHIRLTFPPARKYALDFLDNQRTRPPCGMPKGDQTTSLKAGSTFNVTWQMGLLHQGNHQIEIITKDAEIVELFSWNRSSTLKETTQSQRVTLPKELTCKNCTLRLLRQAREFGEDYIFWSCADVDILKPENYNQDKNLECLGRGNRPELIVDNGISNSCKCNKGYTGARCELQTECDSDNDCGQGKCIEIGKIGQCFCKYPYFGKTCSKLLTSNTKIVPLPNSKTLKIAGYRTVKLSDDVALYTKKIYASTAHPQMEFVMIINEKSFGGLGWRPVSFNKSCKSHWPYRSLTKESNFVPTFSRSNGSRMAFDDSKDFANAFKAEVRLISAHGSEPSPADTIQTHEIENAPFKAMDCTDMVIGAARGEYSRIRDYYTMDRSTPQLDSFWGGMDDILGATGWETNSKTVLVFRKPIKSADLVTDHNLSGNLQMIWSKGQELSAVDYPLHASFYARDELKYHGYGSKQRGIFKIQLDN